MNRAAFTTGMLALAGAPRIAYGEVPELARAVASIPGITGVYAQRLDGRPPFVAIRAGEPFAAASIIKLAIMVTAFRAFDAGTASPRDLVTLRASDLVGGSEILDRARGGERYRLDVLIRAMIRQSDNSAANALITAFSFTTINATMRTIGMTGSHLGRHFASVVAPWRISENIVTPRDIGRLLVSIERGAREGLDTVARSASCRAMIDILLGQEDRTKIPAGLPRGTPVANKTGEINEVRNDAAIVDPYGDAPYVLVVFTRALRDTNAGDRGIAAIARVIDRTAHPSTGPSFDRLRMTFRTGW